MIGNRLGGVISEDHLVGGHVDEAVGEHEIDALGVRGALPAGNLAVHGVLTLGVLRDGAGINQAGGGHEGVALVGQVCGGIEVAAEQYRGGFSTFGQGLREADEFLSEEGLTVEVPPRHVGGGAPERTGGGLDEGGLRGAALHLEVGVIGGHLDGLDAANRQAREDCYALVVALPPEVGLGEGPLVGCTHFIECLYEEQGVAIFADRDACAAAVVQGFLHHGGGGELVDFLQGNDIHLLFNDEFCEGADFQNLVDFAPAVGVEGEETHIYKFRLGFG